MEKCMQTYRLFNTPILLLVLAFSLVACEGTGGTTNATPTASPSQSVTGPKGLPLYCPLAVAIDHQDHLYVSDSDSNTVHERIIQLSTTGQALNEWHIFPAGNIGTTQGPGPLAVDAQGNVYVIDIGQNQVVKVSSAGKVLTRLGSSGSGPGQFEGPVAVAVDSHGTVYVGDTSTGTARIEKFSDTGTFLGIVAAQVKPGAISLAVDSSDNLYIANDIFITKVAPSGQILSTLRLTVDTSQASVSWIGLGINAQGNFYGASLTVPRFGAGFYPRLLKIDLTTGNFLATWDIWKSGITEIGSIALDSQGNLYATEKTKSGDMQLQKFSSTGAVLATWQGTCASS
jgi:hypothetical protein